MMVAIKLFKVFGAGGESTRVECIEWAKSVGLPVVLDLGKASALTGYPILPFLIDQSAPCGFSIDQSEIAQICIFIFQYSVCTWLETLGIHAHAVIGHSLG